MFDFVRQHNRIMQFMLFLLIFPSFVLFGIEGYSRFTDKAAAVARVDGNKITQQEWDDAHKREVDRIRAQMPNVDPKLLDSPQARMATLEQMVNERVLRYLAKATINPAIAHGISHYYQLAFVTMLLVASTGMYMGARRELLHGLRQPVVVQGGMTGPVVVIVMTILGRVLMRRRVVELRLALVHRVGREHHIDLLAKELGLGIGVAHAGEFVEAAFDHGKADLGVGELAAAELEAELHLVAVREELLGMAELRQEIVLGDAGGELDLLDAAAGGLRVTLLLLLLVDVLAEVHDAAHGRRRIGGHLDEVEPYLKREVDGLGRVEDAQLLAFGGDHPDLRNLDAVVAADGRERVVVTTLIGWTIAATGGGKRIGHQ